MCQVNKPKKTFLTFKQQQKYNKNLSNKHDVKFYIQFISRIYDKPTLKIIAA